LPVPGGSVPAFSFHIANGQGMHTDPATGITRPVSPRTISYTLIDTQVKRTGPDMGPIPITHSPDDKAKAAKSAKQGKKKTR
jgi:hypothetical protein